MRTLCASMALLLFSAVVNATPIEYSFELTVTEMKTGERVDPYYANFHLGQTFQGRLTYDPSAPIKTSRGYHNTTSLSVQFLDTQMTTRHGYREYEPGNFAGTSVNLGNGADGGQDGFSLFEEVPLVDGGYLGDFQAEEFGISLYDYDGAAISSPIPAPIDFTLFDGGKWNFWTWGNERLYSSLRLYGTVGNIREVPEPPMLATMLMGLVGVTIATLRQSRPHRRRKLAH